MILSCFLNETATGFMPWSSCYEYSVEITVSNIPLWKAFLTDAMHGCSVFNVGQCYNVFYAINHALRGPSVRNNSFFEEKIALTILGI